MTIIDNLKAEPRLNQVYGRMGFKPGRHEIPESMQEMVDEVIELGKKLVAPAACYTHLSIMTKAPSRIEVADAFVIESEKVFKWIEGCAGIYLAAITLGPGIDGKVAEFSGSRDVTRAFLLNAYGAEAAEALMVELNNHIIMEAETKGWTTTKRYSPGYGDWSIDGQRGLFAVLNASEIGIRLTDTCIMIPEKSISAIIGTK